MFYHNAVTSTNNYLQEEEIFFNLFRIVIYNFAYGLVSDLMKKYRLEILFSQQIRLLDFTKKKCV
jgi:hypothetical protein